MGVPPFMGIISACSPSCHSHVERTRTPCGLILSVMVLSGGPVFARARGARLTSIIIGSLFSSLPVRRRSEFIPYAPLVKELVLLTGTTRAGAPCTKGRLGAWLSVADGWFLLRNSLFSCCCSLGGFS